MDFTFFHMAQPCQPYVYLNTEQCKVPEDKRAELKLHAIIVNIEPIDWQRAITVEEAVVFEAASAEECVEGM